VVDEEEPADLGGGLLANAAEQREAACEVAVGDVELGVLSAQRRHLISGIGEASAAELVEVDTSWYCSARHASWRRWPVATLATAASSQLSMREADEDGESETEVSSGSFVVELKSETGEARGVGGKEMTW